MSISHLGKIVMGIVEEGVRDHLLDYWGQVGNIATPTNPTGLLHFASFGIHTKCPANKQDGDNMRNILHKK